MESLDNTEEDSDIGIIQHITESDKKLFPETPSNEAYKTAKYDSSETRRVYINNDWKIKDSTGSTDFDELGYHLSAKITYFNHLSFKALCL